MTFREWPKHYDGYGPFGEEKRDYSDRSDFHGLSLSGRSILPTARGFMAMQDRVRHHPSVPTFCKVAVQTLNAKKRGDLLSHSDAACARAAEEYDLSQTHELSQCACRSVCSTNGRRNAADAHVFRFTAGVTLDITYGITVESDQDASIELSHRIPKVLAQYADGLPAP
ncbi:uncharacterized protein PHACADRAFT_187445 [Phanerochaete carnosa HHB-10118-sp]|uniref:Uncharacterized protein n=1 Tax=Phanerochaete carnosa (strain HHB-10118-sp) TaxID=650164 RepID=K5VZQ3_PHACS|nr:uncharacterized protein PHACADRAFT_187445 [Phanerochaete carnosa HHB-10118-sp]EKM52104.1 hypothetical protein PHACADRAFT_187445 [Phanerochaete carnosa HHB-10118-sp]